MLERQALLAAIDEAGGSTRRKLTMRGPASPEVARAADLAVFDEPSPSQLQNPRRKQRDCWVCPVGGVPDDLKSRILALPQAQRFSYHTSADAGPAVFDLRRRAVRISVTSRSSASACNAASRIARSSGSSFANRQSAQGPPLKPTAPRGNAKVLPGRGGSAQRLPHRSLPSPVPTGSASPPRATAQREMPASGHA